jgi:hypothetical protein
MTNEFNELMKFGFRHKHHNYEVPAKYIAEARADYYACHVDGFEKGSKEWQQEYEYSFDHYELNDWFYNNMNFEDIQEHAIKLDRYECEEDSKT